MAPMEYPLTDARIGEEQPWRTDTQQGREKPVSRPFIADPTGC